MYTVCSKDENKEKEAGKGPFLKEKYDHMSWDQKSIENVVRLTRLKAIEWLAQLTVVVSRVLVGRTRVLDEGEVG